MEAHLLAQEKIGNAISSAGLGEYTHSVAEEAEVGGLSGSLASLNVDAFKEL